MALWAVAFLGSTPLGAPIVGAISEHLSPRGGLVVGGVACLLAAGPSPAPPPSPAPATGRPRPLIS